MYQASPAQTAALLSGDPYAAQFAAQQQQANLMALAQQRQHSSLDAAVNGAALFVTVYVALKGLLFMLISLEGLVAKIGLTRDERMEREMVYVPAPPAPRPEHPLAKLRASRPQDEIPTVPVARRRQVYRPGEGWISR